MPAPRPRAIVFAVALICGCGVHKANERPEAPVAAPAEWGQAEGDREASERWWTDFGDEALDGYVDAVLAGSLDLQAAWARLDQADAMARQAGSARWPQVQAEVGASHTRTSFNVGEPIGIRTVEQSRFPIGLAASYEVDLWGKVASAKRAAELAREAGRDDVETAAMTLAAQAAETYFGLAEQRAQRALLEQQISTARRLIELVELRFSKGMAGAVDVLQARQQLVGLEAQVPLVEARAMVLSHQLAVLAGRPPSEQVLDGAGELPEPPALPKLGLPAEILDRRPDVRAARRRVAALDHQIGVALADRFPTLRLTGSTGFQATDPAELLSQWVWSVAGSVSASIWDGGRRAAEVSRAKAALREGLAGYGRALLQALREVEDALATDTRQGKHIARVKERIELLRQTLDESEARYAGGLSDYLPVLSSQSELQRAEISLLTARKQWLSARVQLHRALGGRWTSEIRPLESASPSVRRRPLPQDQSPHTDRVGFGAVKGPLAGPGANTSPLD